MAEGTALLVIDMQEAVLAGCAGVPGVVARINDLLARARLAGVPVVFIQHEDAEDPEMTAGSPGWRIAADLDQLPEDAVVAKRYRDSFAATELGSTLDGWGTRRLLVTGAQSDFCVQTTALSALFHGYDVTLVADGHTTEPAAQPGGELSADSLTELVNRRFATLRQPGRRVEVVPAVAVVL
ncbi:MAG: cysteine hydrolase family protein [Candidatus Dormibacteria bacterium]|jgi:nicotinamidase-related amidase